MLEREKAVDLAVSQIEKQFGKGSIMRLGNDEPLPDGPPGGTKECAFRRSGVTAVSSPFVLSSFMGLPTP